ncbi:MAG: hypothetical protein LBU51_09830, partial [Bacteroidales bacterium]|nr:hypothetical protein [Bacteroidales bacterium]
MNTIDIVITAFFVVGYIVLAIAKKNKQKKPDSVLNDQETEEPIFVQDEFEENTPLEENLQKSPKTEDYPYFTYDNF